MEIAEEECQLYEALKNLPDFDSYPIPQSWFKKFNIPPRNPVGVREYIHSNYAMSVAMAPKDLPPLIIDEPQQNGKLIEMAPAEDIPVEVVSRPFEVPEGKPFPAILPSLTERGLDALSHHQASNQHETEQSSSVRKQDEKDETSVQ